MLFFQKKKKKKKKNNLDHSAQKPSNLFLKKEEKIIKLFKSYSNFFNIYQNHLKCIELYDSNHKSHFLCRFGS
jgi:hypothetical protein